MYLVFLFAVTFAINFLMNLTARFCTDALRGKGFFGQSVAITVTALIACAFFIISSGFNIQLNIPTLIYSLIFGILCVFSNLIGYSIYRYASVSTTNTFTSSVSLVATSIVGFIAFSEPITTDKLFKIILVLFIIFIIFLEGKAAEPKPVPSAKYADNKNRSNFIMFILLGSLSACISCCCSVLNKLYSAATNVCDDSSYFFMTNVVMLLFGLISCVFASKGKPAMVKDALSSLGTRAIFLIVLRTILSNTASLVALLIYATNIDLSLYSPLSAALGLIAAASASLILREKLSPLALLATAIAIVAVVI